MSAPDDASPPPATTTSEDCAAVLAACAAMTRAANGLADREFAGAFSEWSDEVAGAADDAARLLRRLEDHVGAVDGAADETEAAAAVADALFADVDAVLGAAPPAGRR